MSGCAVSPGRRGKGLCGTERIEAQLQMLAGVLSILGYNEKGTEILEDNVTTSVSVATCFIRKRGCTGEGLFITDQ